tara:strand:+ start:2749 stop:4008 length:1260 start_codon:yes stop_codon:yes gene_type:complete
MRFKKPIVTTGVYTIPGDTPRKVEVTSDRLSHWANQFSAMKDAGVSVPAPWNHSDSSLPMSIGNDGTLPRSDINAGWWDKVWVEDNTLWGELDVPQNEDAVKIGTSVKESSIYVRPTFVDGSGNEWKDSLMHIALVTHPIENGQGNFEPVESDGLALAMSQLTEPLSMAYEDKEVGPGESRESQSNGLQGMLEALRACQIDLPEDTNEVNFMERLLVALRQKKTSEQPEESSVTSLPEGAKEQPAPVAMSQEKNNEIQEVTSDDTQVQEEVIMSHPKFKAANQTINFLLNHIGSQEKGNLVARRNALVESGKITEAYAQEHLDASIGEFKMSFGEDGKPEVSSAATIMDALEAAPSLTSSLLGKNGQDSSSLERIALAMSQSGMTGLPVGLTEEPMESEDGPNADDIALEFLKNTGHAS